jgi:hypothetical protein
MYIPHSPAEKRRVLFFQCAEHEHQRRPWRALARADRPTPARDVAPGDCWAFTDHRTMAEVMAEDLS